MDSMPVYYKSSITPEFMPLIFTFEGMQTAYKVLKIICQFVSFKFNVGVVERRQWELQFKYYSAGLMMYSHGSDFFRS